MNPAGTPKNRKGGFSALLLVSVFILITDACFIWINYRSDWQALQQKQQQRADYERQAFSLALSTVATNMQQLAYMVAHDPEVQRLFLQAKKAVAREGGGAGGPEADRIRKELYHHLEDIWSEMADRYDVRQLHFHLPPGSLSFLRVHKPDKFGDTMHDVRFTIVDVNKNRLPVKGFETGRVYSGIRGVVPVYARDPQSGERVFVGALEAGTSFETLLGDLSSTFDANFAVLLDWEHVRRNMWHPRLQQRFPDGNIKGWVVEQGGDTAESLLYIPAVRKLLHNERQGTLLMTESTPPLVVDSFPLYDFRGEKEGLPPVGRLLEWRDITPEIQAFRAALLTNIIYGLVGFVLIELLLFVAWRVGSGRLSRLVARRTEELQQTTTQLKQEINERLRTEQAMSEYAEQYRAIFDDNSCVMLLVEPTGGRIVRANTAAARFYGFDQETLQNMHIGEINSLPPDSLKEVLARTDAVKSIRHEFTHRLANGEERIVAVHSGPVIFEGQRVLFSIIIDITRTKNMEKQLREALEELEAIFENSQVAVVLLRGGRIISRVNQHFCDLLGYTPDEVEGQGVEILHLSQQHFEEFGRLHYESLKTGVRRQIEYPLRRKDGSSIWCLISGKALSPPQLDKGVTWVASDITAIKEAERMREDVQRIMRHDLKTPLNSIMGVPQLLRLDGKLNEEQTELISILEDSARRMLSIIELSLDLIKMESGTYQLKREEVDLVAIVSIVCRELGEMQRRKSLGCEVSLEARPLQENDRVLAHGEERLCYTIVANLLRNAFEAAPANSTVSLAFSHEQDMVRLQIHNQGSVPSEICETFFDKYATWGKSEGTGLGTYSARLAVEIQGGSIDMRSEGGSTILDIRLPAA